MSRSWQVSRRTVLRGLGASISLPMFNAMAPISQAATAGKTLATSAAGLPIRTAYVFVPNGVNLSKWTPLQDGYNYDLPEILRPLSSLKDKVNVLTGLTHDKGRANGDGAGDHARSASVFLTAAQPRKTSGGNIRSGVSVDQVAAKHIGHLTKFASLELGCDGGRNSGNCDSGYSCAYSNNISWAGPATPMSKETNPRLVFERLFGGDTGKDKHAADQRTVLRKSLLDFVSEDAKRLQNRLGRNDQDKLAEYLSAVRSIERRIELAEMEDDNRQLVNGYSKPEGIPKEYMEHVRLMVDMMVLAFQTDMTRTATCMFANAGSNRSYRNIDVPDGHHDLSHHGGNDVKLEKIAKINHFHVQQLAYFLKRLDSIPEGDGTLLDQCMIMYGSGLSDGNRHNNENLPVLLAGGGGGSIETGRHIRYRTETPLANLFLSMLDRSGVQVPRIGDSTGLLPYLS